MKKILFSVLVIFLLASCSSKTSFENRSAQLPDEIKKVIETLPSDSKDEMLFPTKLLSESYTVDFGYTSEPVYDSNGKIVLSYLIYASEEGDWNITLNTFHIPSTPSNESKDTETVKLKNGTVATYSETKDGLQRVILWTDDDITHEISLIENPERSKPKYTKEEFLEVVNTLQ
ncbi:hypothetical protein [Neobacillus niacini]|uniref:hypothetical protein n=1 Tax=Neobacillus niacini TaxID=86668 RepID=UPI003982EA96